MRFSAWLTIVQAALLAALLEDTARGAIFTETWESPAIPSGTTSTSRPAPWIQYNGIESEAVIIHFVGTDTFHQTDPLASPASGNQALRLAKLNTGVYRPSGAFILPNTIYTYSVAIGNDIQSTTRSDSWAISLWADVNGNGFFDGTPFDSLIAQQTGTNISGTLPTNPMAGEWATNSITFDSATRPDLVGKQIITFLNNFLNDGVTYYDNVTLTTVTEQAAVPEPASVLLWSVLAVGGIATVRRRRHVQARD